MAFPPSFLDELSARNPIVEVVGQYVRLTRKGSNLFGLCPFHAEKTPSFSVAPDKGIYYCFGCHKGGGVVNFIMEQESLDFLDAVRFLAKRAGMEVPDDGARASGYRRQERLWALCKDAARYFRAQLFSPAGAPGQDYIRRRALSLDTVKRFGLGYAPNGWSGLLDAMGEKGYAKQDLLDAGLAVKSDKGGVYDRFRGRLMFPIIDVRGSVIGFGGRVLDDSKPKYLNSPETVIFNKRKNLFALNIAKKSKQGRIILTEGYMDAIALHQYGFDCAVASLGTSLTEEHAGILAKYTRQVVITYDGDAAGQNATRRAIDLLEKTGVQVRVLRMQGAKDPDEFLKQYGPDRFRLLLERAENHVEYRLDALRRQFDLTADDQRVAFLRQAANLIASLPSAVEREVYGVRAAEAAGISPEAMKLEADKAYRQRRAQARRRQAQKDLAPAAAAQPQSRELRYENVRSAMAEEGVLRLVLKEPALLDACRRLEPEHFSAPLLGRAYGLLRAQYEAGRPVGLGSLGEAVTPAELGHLSAVAQKTDELVSEQALADCLAVIDEEYARRQVAGAADLQAFHRRLQEKKGYGGN
ncbi:MAG: DNA primase [Oscillospiraceae bacterium]|nr:DNA primase [Oscillospiraceae bacterium]